jgi:hypothetical protein
MRLRGAAALAAAATFLAAAGGVAQPAQAQALRDRCEAVIGMQPQCISGDDAAEILQTRLGLLMSGGNPVPGTASTLGMRLGSMPRMSLTGRITGLRVDAPDTDFTALALHLDASVGVFQGLSVLPTVGGLASLDLLASVGVMPVPRGSEYGAAPGSWAIGARAGILRESFTAPGISVSAMYRSVGSFRTGAAGTTDSEPAVVGGRDVQHVRLSDQRVVSYRAVVGKRFAGIGLLAGAGHDRFRADATVRVLHPTSLSPVQVTVSETGMRNTRNSLFMNASLTMLILNLSAEAGWQQGGERGADRTRELGRGGLFGGVAARLAI